ncbi:MAG: hypothetical protein KDB18_13980, partial [Salinibacterium sp.]|nr:hypothetical protein [Salinibacterium sp.]
LASSIVVVFFTIYVASQFDAAGTSLAESFRDTDLALDRRHAILIGAAIVLFYTLMGGFWAVSVTDTLQGLLMAATAFVLPLVALSAVGPMHFFEAMRNVDQPGFTDLFADRGLAAGFGFVLGLLGIGLNYPGQPHVVNRFMALGGGDRELRRARRIAMTWAIVVYAGMILLGLCGRVILQPLASSEGVFIAVARETLHPVVAGIMIAAVLSAIMSTADSQLLVAASAVAHDLREPGAPATLGLFSSRMVVCGVSVSAVVVALFVDARIFEQVLFAFSAMGAAFGPLFVVRLFWGPVSGGHALASMFSGLALVVFAKLVAPALQWPEFVLGDGAAVSERVVPLVVAFLIARRGACRSG